MTHKEFINATFRRTDKIVVRQYFTRHTEKIVSVDFMEETINGYRIAQIEQHIIPNHDEENKQSN